MADLTVCVCVLLVLRCGCWSSPALCLCQLDTSCQCLSTVSEGTERHLVSGVCLAASFYQNVKTEVLTAKFFAIQEQLWAVCLEKE